MTRQDLLNYLTKRNGDPKVGALLETMSTEDLQTMVDGHKARPAISERVRLMRGKP